MKKIIDFFISQIMSIIVFFGVAAVILGFLYKCFNEPSNLIVFYDEKNIGDYQIIIDLNTGETDINKVLNLELENLINNKISLKINSFWETTLILSIILTIIMYILNMISYFIKYMIMFSQDKKYKEKLKDKFDLSDESFYELPRYEPIIANAIYTKNYQYETIVNRLKKYYRSVGILDILYNLKENVDFDIDSLTEIEQFVFNSKKNPATEVVKNLFKDYQNVIEKEKSEFKGLVRKELKEKGFYQDDKLKIKVDNFFDFIINMNLEKIKKLDFQKIIRNIFICILIYAVLSFFEVVFSVIFLIILIIAVKYSRISLSMEGEIERAKIHFLIKYLKRKKYLTEEEKYFLEILTGQ